MLTLYGAAVTAENARHIVASLFADGSPAAVSAAAMIQKGVDRDLYAVALEPDERDALLAVLEDPPEGLEDLRGRLARDHPASEARQACGQPRLGVSPNALRSAARNPLILPNAHRANRAFGGLPVWGSNRSPAAPYACGHPSPEAGCGSSAASTGSYMTSSLSNEKPNRCGR